MCDRERKNTLKEKKKKGELVAENRIESDAEKKETKLEGERNKRPNEMTRGMRTRTTHN